MSFKLSLNDEKIKEFQTLTTIDAHTEGEPLRIILDGYPEVPGTNILAKRRCLQSELDHLRQVLMYEPRGHADMYGALLTEPTTEGSDFGILFMHNEGYSSMCGHGIIAAVTMAAEYANLEVLVGQRRTVGIDAPAGKITAYAERSESGELAVSFDNVESFVEVCDRKVHVPGFGELQYDIAYGGAYYAYVDADAIDVDCSPNNSEQLIQLGRSIKHAVMADYPLVHPTEEDLGFLYGTIFTSKKTDEEDSHSRHVCIFADGEVDRSPTGTGVSARIALLHHRGEVSSQERIKIESIIGSSMQVEIASQLDFEGKPAVIPRVFGTAFITGVNQFLIDSNDPLKHGFLIR
ncbi:proline racemase family protein [uncultured Pseudoteredinibacter sp.]|uniref:proline racemase family protein n=1 Tax=uncultured Pseudoteredinibacter sp. TaxID=1641701 RepID=UPI00262813C3|nr:proline racemase family protein [uncultured Pseudoteredinibacter sp.]